MTILEKIKKSKLGIYFLLGGIFLTILFISFVMMQHINTLKVKNTYSSFSTHKSYEIVYQSTKKNEKRKLFAYQNYHFYGYGIGDLGIDYQGIEVNLRTAFNQNYFTFEEFLKNFTLIYESDDKTITKYENKNLEIRIDRMYENDIEVIFSKRG